MAGPDDFAAPEAKKPRQVVFEPIRLPSIYNVRALNEKILPAQHYKLAERFRIKLRQIGLLEKRIEELENRHSSDDELICIINRQWNQLDDIMVDLLKRYVDEGNLSESASTSRDESNWLAVVSQLNNDEIAERLSSRVNFSTDALTHLLKAINAVSEKRERILTLLEPPRKDRHDISPETNGDDSNDAIGEMNDSMEAQDNIASKQIEIDSALKQEILELVGENKRLESLVIRLEAKKNKLSSQLAMHNDQLELAEAKTENAVNQLEDLRFELEKSISREEKLQTQLVEFKKNEQLIKAESSEKEKQSDAAEKKTNVESSNVTDYQYATLQHDMELQIDVSEKRLVEIQNVNQENQELKMKVHELETQIKFLPTSAISSSPDYICLRLKYSNIYEEMKRMESNNADLKAWLVDLRSSYEEQVTNMKNEFNMAMQRMQENCTQMSDELLQVKKECSMMELEFKQKIEVDGIEARNYKEMKVLIDAARSEAKRRTEEMNRMKKQMALLKTELVKTKADLEEARKINDTCIVISLEEKPNDVMKDIGPLDYVTESANSNLPAMSTCFSNQKKIKVEIETQKNVKDEKHVIPSFDHVFRRLDNGDSKPELTNSERTEGRLIAENEALRERLRKLHRSDKVGSMEKARRQIQQLNESCERLKRELASANQAEEGLMKEMENTEKAVEGLMAQNTTLAGRVAEQEETYIRLVKGGLQSETTIRVMKQTIEALEEKVRTVENEREASQIEASHWAAKAEHCKAMMTTTESNLRKATNASETFRKSVLSIGSDLNEMKVRFDKQQVEIHDLRQQLKESVMQGFAGRNKITRLREERNVLRKKLGRAKQAAEYENIDELLQEENRVLRESLACPSCKTGDKNTVLTKCFHVFCMECIKRRYDARSRKCPKCNATFGANDYHRIYLE